MLCTNVMADAHKEEQRRTSKGSQHSSVCVLVLMNEMGAVLPTERVLEPLFVAPMKLVRSCMSTAAAAVI